MGMPLYGQSFTLNDPLVNGLNAPARTGGTAGPFTRARGFLAYYEVGVATSFVITDILLPSSCQLSMFPGKQRKLD